MQKKSTNDDATTNKSTKPTKTPTKTF